MSTEKKLSHKRLTDFEMVDEIRIRIVPRYKTSGMSGDEWRQHTRIEFMFKGEVIREAGLSRMEGAIMALGREYLACSDDGMTDAMMALDDKKCDQPSCQNDAIGRFEIKHEFGRQGEDIVQSNYYRHYRKFCSVHLRRGDCSREDCDDNYIPLGAVGPNDSTNTQESPSAFGGVVHLDAEDFGNEPPAMP